MKGFIKCCFVFLILVSVLLFGMPPESVSAQSKLWTSGPAIKINDDIVPSGNIGETQCTVSEGYISIKGWNGLRRACIYGSSGGLRFARYEGSLYAVAFPLEDSFTQFRAPCTYNTRCVYGQAGDMLLTSVQAQYGLQTIMIKNLSKRLERHTDEGVYYTLTTSDSDAYVSLGTQRATTYAMSASPNGKWGVVELKSYGFVRINLQTGEYKRVVAPGGSYGYGFDPSYELAISNDGSKLAITGWNTSISIYEIDDECGDLLTNTTQNYFSPYVYPCPQGQVDVYQLFPGFQTASNPRFSEQGELLTLYVSYGQQTHLAVLAHSAYNKTNQDSYVAFGDSFTSGEGETSDSFYIEGTNTPTNKCHVSARSYPLLVGGLWGINSTNKACSGARAADVQEVGAAFKATPSVISVGIGGNDIGLMGKLSTCLTPTSCEWASDAKRLAGANEIRAFFPRIVELMTNLQQKYASSKLVVVGYPGVVNTSPGSKCSALISTLLDEKERQYMDESVKYLNKVLKAAADYKRLPYIDIEDAFLGERICDSKETAMNTIRVGDDIAPISMIPKLKIIGAESFHPTPRGHQLIAAKIKERYATWQELGCNDCLFDEAALTPEGYWAEAGGVTKPVTQRAERFLATDQLKPGDEVAIKLEPGSLTANTTVTVEMHSEPKQLARLQVSNDGSLEARVKLPDQIEGYHTVHVYGTSPSGIEQDLYQTIAIGDEEMMGPNGGSVAQTPIPYTARSSGEGTRVASISSALAAMGGASTNQVATTSLLLRQPAEAEGKTNVVEAGVLGVADERVGAAGWAYIVIVAVVGLCLVSAYYVYRRYKSDRG